MKLVPSRTVVNMTVSDKVLFAAYVKWFLGEKSDEDMQTAERHYLDSQVTYRGEPGVRRMAAIKTKADDFINAAWK